MLIETNLSYVKYLLLSSDKILNDTNNFPLHYYMLEEETKCMQKKSHITPEFYIGSSKGRIIGFLAISYKKLIRKMLGWYFREIVYQQNQFNESVLITLDTSKMLMQEILDKEQLTDHKRSED